MIAYRATVTNHPCNSHDEPMQHGVSLPMPPALLAEALGAVPYAPPPKAPPPPALFDARAAKDARIAAVLKSIGNGEKTLREISEATGMSEQFAQQSVRFARQAGLVASGKIPNPNGKGWISLHKLTAIGMMKLKAEGAK